MEYLIKATSTAIDKPKKLLAKYPVLTKYRIFSRTISCGYYQIKQETLFIRIDTLEELKKLIKDLKEPVIVDDNSQLECTNDDYDTIEIYDDYRE